MAEAKQVITVPAPIQSKFNITLTENGFQAMADKAAKLVFNEDHLEEIKTYLEDFRKVELAIEKTHKQGKEPSLILGKQWDKAKNDFLEMTSAIKTGVHQKYTKLCQDVADKQKKQALEQARVKGIKDGIEMVAVHFSSLIAGATTSTELTEIERKINLEKTRKEKYMEFLAEAAERYSQLNSLLKDQKIKVKELEELQLQKQHAEEKGDEQTLIDIAGKEEEIAQSIDESKILVQEKAAEQAINTMAETGHIVYPTVRAKRSTWKWEVKDINVTQKKMPSFVELVPKEKAIDDYLAAKKAEGITGEEFEVFGIRFYLDKTY